MRLLRPLAILALVLAAALMPAAEVVTAKLAKKGNVRYGPSKLAPITVTLPTDATVEILGRVTRDDGVWYQIRFPREGKAWMHAKTLKVTADAHTYEVIEDKARVRDDATAGANIVTELAKGETVEFRDNIVGAWMAVYPAKAVAYVHESVLAVPQSGIAAVGPVVPQQRAIDRLWITAKATYAQYAGTKDLKSALTLDWAGLSQQLADVAKNHPEVSVRLEAGRLKDGVDRVVKEQVRQNAHATVSVSQPPAEPVAQDPVKPVDVVVPVNPADPLATIPKPASPDTPPVVPSPDVQQVIAPVAPASVYIVEGILEQRGEIFEVFDNKGKVVAVLQAKPGATLQLTDYYWRDIGVKGTSPGSGKDDQGNDVPIVLIDDVELLKR